MTQIPVRENLTMRSLTAQDAPEVYGVIDENRDYLRKWLPWVDETNSAEKIRGIFEKWEQDEVAGTDIVLGIFQDGAYVGNIGLHDLRRSNQSGMIGYWLSAARQGQGIMTDCVQALTDYAFRELKLNRVYIYCAAENQKSRAIPARLGFLEEGVLQDGTCLYGTYHDQVIYGMVARRWTPLRRPGLL